MAVEYGKTLIVGHRGEPFIAPENTMASFNLAWKLGDAAVETDIHLTSDGKVVICHDADTFRTSGNKQKVVMKDATLADIQKVDVGSFKDPKYAGEICPTLEDLYASVPGPGHMVYTEIKSGIDVVPAFVDIVKHSKLTPDQIIVISFHADALEASKKALPNYKHYLLMSVKKGKNADPAEFDKFISQAKDIHADGLDIGTSPRLNKAECKKILDAGLELHLWTNAKIDLANSSVDDPKVARQYIDWGAQSITTNRSHWLKEQLTNMDK
ncbi:MAG TPA: glycerophosphodiester phosphodiesterase family protein [Tepidisphaeraceae bacterium]|nr:glycerophosphodiester phosphodiesterase family protein [Tepidisphaeraceae bacterium]